MPRARLLFPGLRQRAFLFRGVFPMRAVLFGVCLLSTVGCQPRIGDDCEVDLDCSQIGDRICDTTQPGGYCTQFNCDPTSCPEGEGICIAFSNTPSKATGCSNLGRTSPYARSFCMKSCEEDRDCRDGYVCIDVARENPWGADIIQEDPANTNICVLPSSSSAVPEEALTDLDENVCLGAQRDGFGGAGGAPAEGGASGG